MAANSKAFVVTGAARGLGAAAVAALASRGCNVLAVDIDSEEVERGAETAASLGGEVVAHAADVSDSDAVAAAVAAAQSRFGGLDGIFNNAAIEGPWLKLEEYPDEQFDRVFHVNTRGVWLGIKHAIPALRANGGGAIVNTASSLVVIGHPGLGVYSAAKHAVIGLTKAAAVECAGENIRVNSIIPGPMDTPLFWNQGGADYDADELIKTMSGVIPVGRLGRPDEVAALAAWLLLDGPEIITGANIVADGALTLV